MLKTSYSIYLFKSKIIPCFPKYHLQSFLWDHLSGSQGVENMGMYQTLAKILPRKQIWLRQLYLCWFVFCLYHNSDCYWKIKERCSFVWQRSEWFLLIFFTFYRCSIAWFQGNPKYVTIFFLVCFFPQVCWNSSDASLFTCLIFVYFCVILALTQQRLFFVVVVRIVSVYLAWAKV